ncbi:MAG TPA: phosphoribosylaminoimidazolesuccinocarboxamide synthase [Planctomycetota bacterium]|jgi:phosphoribosylaminoimidazole-succinocarboxamide synthase|nr:phosphoribosylaminoimidazolesuccinocarboxamide synthase [Planctomycetota bacterium]MDP7245685.1 phosphoribosylaminoimidazolesuccinocarboxamide synthase [Planctomycetota bacterium]HJM39135.1 phosphoribosylaminoimidazolesuccinocarboxamide synthase [Planctomycetota bacterium]|tara:strand:- start:38413 stop:39342 length:930 start_codon:yes stop_codon:yes gene_type:complete
MSCPSPSTALSPGYAGGLEIPGWDFFYKGKVRDLYQHPNHPDHMLMVATDRLSAFDVVMEETVPDRGRVLTHITEYWLNQVSDLIPAARVTVEPSEIPDLPQEFHDALRGRATWTRRAERVNVEIVLRAFLAGSGWREYEANGSLWEHQLPTGLQKSSRLPEVLHTPTTKAEIDEPITWAEAVELIGSEEDAALIHEVALKIFKEAANTASSKGVLLADTKFEFGRIDGKLVLIDEVMTPDSSRYWPENEVVEGAEPPSFDKEIVRAYLRSLTDWNRKPPPPTIPAEVITQTRSRYLEICEILTGNSPV